MRLSDVERRIDQESRTQRSFLNRAEGGCVASMALKALAPLLTISLFRCMKNTLVDLSWTLS